MLRRYIASGWSASALKFALRMITVRFLSAGDWNAYRSHRSRRGSPMGGPRLRPVKWFDIILSFPRIIFWSPDPGHRGDVKAAGLPCETVLNGSGVTQQPGIAVY